ncbi:5-oxoprolinase subunit PxpA [Paenibacillus sp. GD4]|jgi:5-oxoprolinase (ATP-hydrolysing) subunit A|uniref:LamB/YcsF family protein n=1 Tax=Paenibacillus sp. GD4 TaxID=3068890 RepID=UPI002796AB82|nr:5-oxoprolinase subunit PxpA [Paenibacillus sp. GD4]MDQ1910323.1 5-oxoprolinase subunit PxpA [Paenibacillus sp. GD4]
MTTSPKPMTIDLNADMGESFGAYRIGADEALLPYISSANIACGFHAGDPATMRRTVKLCADSQVAIGAHPGLPDLQGFGRRTMHITPEEAFDLIVYQTGALLGFVKAEGLTLHHVKPHGALYNMAAASRPLADAIAQAVYRLDPSLILYGLAGSELVRAADAIGLRSASEAFADRSYEQDGSLTPRSQPGAVLHDPEAVAEQAKRIVVQGHVLARQGHVVPLQADTLCLHGDGPEAPRLAERLRASLGLEQIRVAPPYSA